MKENLLLIENLRYLVIVSNFIFVGGFLNVLVVQNIISWLISVELLFLSSFLNFIAFSLYYLTIDGFIYALLVLIFAAVESAIGLSIISLHFSRNKKLDMSFSEIYTDDFFTEYDPE